MIRLFFAVLLFMFSLLAVLPIPAKQLWYCAIAVSEFPWIWVTMTLALLVWIFSNHRYRTPSAIVAIITLMIFASPIVRAYEIASGLDQRLKTSFNISTADLGTPHRVHPFSMLQMVSGIGASKVPFKTFEYTVHSGVHLTLNFYPSQITGVRPCLLVIHGGSWKSGDNSELPDVDSYFAKDGYQVATINYRLAPQFKSPAPQEDVHAAITWLKSNAGMLNIDSNNFVLMGRSAGGQIALETAYGLEEPGVKGVVSFYGPADMIFGYNEPHNQLVMKHHEVLESYLGGTPAQVRQQYIDASPIEHVKRGSVPALLVHGVIDQHVHFTESQRMAQRLDENGVPNLLLALPWATHGCEYTLNGPSGQLAMYAAERFMYAITQKDTSPK